MPQMCVILTLGRHFLTIGAGLAALSPGRENPRCRDAAVEMWAIKMDKESTPLWVWLSVALLAIGAVGYVTLVLFVEYVLAFF